mmetsp:Transcript_1584/g.6921  ORF Transcript_1584/g.6921 Transcript_1584/m.6921 type:complete len:225 (+) Transcript_1584:1331-2005(+)
MFMKPSRLRMLVHTSALALPGCAEVCGNCQRGSVADMATAECSRFPLGLIKVTRRSMRPSMRRTRMPGWETKPSTARTSRNLKTSVKAVSNPMRRAEQRSVTPTMTKGARDSLTAQALIPKAATQTRKARGLSTNLTSLSGRPDRFKAPCRRQAVGNLSTVRRGCLTGVRTASRSMEAPSWETLLTLPRLLASPGPSTSMTRLKVAHRRVGTSPRIEVQVKGRP